MSARGQGLALVLKARCSQNGSPASVEGPFLAEFHLLLSNTGLAGGSGPCSSGRDPGLGWPGAQLSLLPWGTGAAVTWAPRGEGQGAQGGPGPCRGPSCPSLRHPRSHSPASTSPHRPVLLREAWQGLVRASCTGGRSEPGRPRSQCSGKQRGLPPRTRPGRTGSHSPAALTSSGRPRGALVMVASASGPSWNRLRPLNWGQHTSCAPSPGGPGRPSGQPAPSSHGLSVRPLEVLPGHC